MQAITGHPRTTSAARRLRPLRLALGALLILTVLGERGAHTQVVGGITLGIDPLRVLDLQVKPNVIFVLDSSGSMQEDPDASPSTISGDDPAAKMYQAKKALNTVISANRGKFNFGMASYNLLNTNKTLRNFPLTYTAIDTQPGWNIWTGGSGYFAGALGTPYQVTNFTTNAADAEVWRSFRRDNTTTSGPGCAVGVACRRYIRSGLFRNNIKFKWITTSTGNPGNPGGVGTSDLLTNISTINCANFPPPPGMFPDDPPGMVRPCMQMENGATGAAARTTTFWYSGPNWGLTGNDCGGAAILEPVAACGVDNFDNVMQKLKLELPLYDQTGATTGNTCGGALGVPCGLTPANLGSTAPAIIGTNPATTAGLPPNTTLGVLSAQRTPIGGTLRDILNSFTTVFPNPGGTLAAQQKNFVIFLTDGAETCSTNAPQFASQLWSRNGHTPGQWAETIVIGFSLTAADQASLNAIACAGSGGTISSCTTTTCACTGGARRNAFSATDLNQLIAALQAALSESTSSGQFEASPSVVASIFEYVGTVAGHDPRNPETRYTVDLPVLFQPSFELPGFKGRLRAFRANGTVALQVWEAGQKLLDRVVNAPGALGDPVAFLVSPTANKYTFAQLHGGATLANVNTSAARIKRRIFTTARNGLTPATTGLWPPDPSVLTGSFDVALGVTYPAAADDNARFVALQTDYLACTGANLPANCSALSPTTRYLEAKREAREMILAHMAGARAVKDDGGVVQRNAANALLFEARSCGDLSQPACGGILAESTNATPAVVTQPPDTPPTEIDEKNSWLLTRDGPRTTAGDAIDRTDAGFGLTNPDSDTKENPPNPSGTSRMPLKPIMSVVYYGTNDMLHALRAGPQCTASGVTTCPSPGDETGGEELWGFVPYDQLGKLGPMMTPKPRDQRVYVIATPLRFTRVFVPGTFTIGTVSYAGRWRTVLIAGRGPGGKYYTALDVTTPRPFTRASLDTLLPSVLWSRGNPDTDNGLPKTAANNYNRDVADYNAYSKMGLTFSVPAAARVNMTPPKFVLITGSGYSSTPGEGATVFALDTLTGNVEKTFDTGSATGDSRYPPNAVVAGPAVFIPTQLDRLQIGNPYGELATRAYVGDLHGRVWRFNLENNLANWPGPSTAPFFSFGVDQPIGVPVALLNYSDPARGDTSNRPYIFGEAGNDLRLPKMTSGVPTTPVVNFVAFALRERDDGTAERAFPDVLLPNERTSPSDSTEVYYRGTAQPATAFNSSNNGRVFYLGTVFKPCVDPPFKSVLFALTAATGDAAYDLNATGDDKAIYVPDLILDKPILTKDGVVTSRGLAAGNPPPPPGGPSSTTGASGPATKVHLWADPRGPVTTMRYGSSVCR